MICQNLCSSNIYKLLATFRTIPLIQFSSSNLVASKLKKLMGRQPCCDKVGLKRGPWTIEEDHKLITYILNNGIQCWRMIPKLAGLLRCGKSCRLRWINYLRPDLKRGTLSEMEENQIIQLHARLGNRWSKIASHFPGRTDNEIKNHWNTRIKKRLKNLGIDPLTHKPIEQKEENRAITDSNSEENFEATLTNGLETENQRKNEDEMKKNETTNGLNNYEMLCRSLDMDLWMNKEANTCMSSNNSYSYSPSFSLENLGNPSSMGESSASVQEESLKQWVDKVDSILSWDGFNQLEEDLFFLDKYPTNLSPSVP